MTTRMGKKKQYEVEISNIRFYASSHLDIRHDFILGKFKSKRKVIKAIETSLDPVNKGVSSYTIRIRRTR